MSEPVITDEREQPEDRRPIGNSRLAIVSVVTLLVIAAAIALALTRTDQRDAVVRAEDAAANVDDPAAGNEPATASPGDSSPADGVPATTEPAGPDSLTMAFAGDLLPHGPLNAKAAEYGAAEDKAYDYAPMLAPMASIIGGADVAICHMEVPVAPPGEEVTSYPSFGSPAELVDGARSAGYDGCSNASNHSLDRGQAGIEATLDRFDLNGLHHAGTARSADEGNTITTYDADGVAIAHLSYAYGFNGYVIPADAPWSVNQIDPARIDADAARARSEGADLVVVSLHWGNEYQNEPSAYQRDIADQILPSPDIDLVIGHHAHVVQPIEAVDGTYVVWGLGNQVSNQTQAPRRDGLTVVATARRGTDGWDVEGIEAVPTYVDLPIFHVLPVAETLADPDTPPGLRAELDASYDRTLGVLLSVSTPGISVDPRP